MLSVLTEEYIQASVLAVDGDTSFLPDTTALMEVIFFNSLFFSLKIDFIFFKFFYF